MNILVTGAGGFVGKNLCQTLRTIQDGRNKTHPDLHIDEIFEYGRALGEEKLAEFCRKADFVFNLAGVNRPKDESEFMRGNLGFTDTVLNALEKCGNPCPVMLASSVQASLMGRYASSDYGKSKLAGEEQVRLYGEKNNVKTFIYRFTNLFGKWCRPNYNSVVATFCHNIANDLPIQVNDPNTLLELLYIDDLVEELLCALEGKEHRCDYNGLEPIPAEKGAFCYVPTTHKVTLGEIAELLHRFADEPQSLIMPLIPDDSFEKKLYSTYLSYLPRDKIAYGLHTNSDPRGSFTELIKTQGCGQMSVNISKPGVTKGEHWHNSKWELFIVVSGHALIQEREIGTDKVLEFEVSGEEIKAVHMLPGYTHNIINLSQTEDLVTLMWANETFDKTKPDTFYEAVEK